jgi:hypothetical protein
MIDTCTVYYLFPDELDELDELLKIPKNPKTEVPIVPEKLVATLTVSACEIYMCALIIQVIMVTTF